MNHICLAIEDALSEAVAEKLLSTSRQPFQITQRLGNSGFGYLKRNLSKFNQLAAKVTPVLLNTELIRYVNNHWDPLTAAECAPSLARAQKRIHELVTRHMESP